MSRPPTSVAGAVPIPVAVLAEEEPLGLAEEGGGGGVAGVAEEGAGVLGEEGVGGVDLAVAGEAEPGRVGPAVEEGRGVAAVVAETLPHSGLGHVLSLVSLFTPRSPSPPFRESFFTSLPSFIFWFWGGWPSSFLVEQGFDVHQLVRTSVRGYCNSIIL